MFLRHRRITDTIPNMPGRLIVKRTELLDTIKKAGTAARDEASQAIALAGAGNGESLDVYCKTGEQVVYITFSVKLIRLLLKHRMFVCCKGESCFPRHSAGVGKYRRPEIGLIGHPLV